MFKSFYDACLVVFLFQGISLPLLLTVAGFILAKQSRRLDALKGELSPPAGEKVGSEEVPDRILKRLPKLQPLNCDRCGAGLLLRPTQTMCPSCHQTGGLPTDYAAAVSIRSQVKTLLKSAVNYWRTARVLTHPLVGWTFTLMVFCEPFILFPTVLIGSERFPKTWADNALKSIGPKTTLLLGLTTLFGFIIWMIVFLMLASLSKALRTKLPAAPVLEAGARGHETANCQACGGGIEYDAGDFACACGYCHVENLRANFVRRERLRSTKQETRTKSALFGAMEIIDEFIGTFFIVAIILIVGSALLTGFYAIKHLF